MTPNHLEPKIQRINSEIEMFLCFISERFMATKSDQKKGELEVIEKQGIC